MSTERKEILKDIIRRLHRGEDVDKIKEEFKKFSKQVTPADISRAEQELVQEGMDVEEIKKLCEVHLAVFEESLGKDEALAPPGHPIYTLMEEHKILLSLAKELKKNANDIISSEGLGSVAEKMKHLDHIVDHMKESESHYLREENVLFLYLEKHGITQPPAVMWTEHDRIREIKRALYKVNDEREKMDFKDFGRQLGGIASELDDMLSSHFQKENRILFPTGMQVIEENEWADIGSQFEDIGYCCFTPEVGEVHAEKVAGRKEAEKEGEIPFGTGSLSREQVEAILNSLPVDVTFVDSEDRVKYFSQSKDRIFVRTKAVIGRKVQQCHPQKSVHLVNQILEEFKSGKKDVADFWINMKGRLIYIRYFPVRNQEGEYLGCLEVTQDITDIKGIEGEKRLL